MATSTSSVRDQTLRLVSRVARRGEGVLASVRARSETALRPATPDGRYGGLWNPSSETEAIEQIYNTSNMESFEQGGQVDFEKLSPYVTNSSIVLDFGCGIGRLAKYVAPACKELWAVDISSTMLDLAAKRLAAYDNVRYVQSRDTGIPDVPTASIDLVYSLLVLQHVEREDAFLLLEELHRVLRPDGRAVLTFPNLLSEIYLDSFLQYARTGASTEPHRARAYTPQEVERVLGAAGFEAEITAETEIWVVAKPR